MTPKALTPWALARISSAAAIAFVSILVVAVSESTGSTFPGVNGRIVFTSDRDGGYEIYSMNSSGGDLRQLTDNDDSVIDMEPVLSPDGKTIAFVSSRDGNYEIYTMKASDGSNQTRRTQSAALDRSPAWYPDGLHLAESRTPSPGSETDSEIYRINVDTGYFDETRLTDDSAGPARADTSPTVTPDGTKVIWERDIGDPGSANQEIFSMNSLTGGSKINLTSHAAYDGGPVSVSPDGSRFAWSRTPPSEVLIADVSDGGNQRIFTDDSDLPSPGGFAPAFSPDGSKLLFGTFWNGGLGSGSPSFYSANLDGTSLTRITPAGDTVYGLSSVVRSDWGRLPTWALTASKTGTGTGSVTMSDSGGPHPNFSSDTVTEGWSATFTATPDSGSAFTGWSGAGCSGTGSCAVTVDLDTTVVANFEKPAAISITGKPRATTRSKIATFRFAPVPGSGLATSYKCKIDRKPTGSCTSAKTYRNLKPGRHTFSVQAEFAGIPGPAATHRWRVR